MPDKKGISAEDQARFKILFNQLDVNKDGKIEIRELTEGLKKLKGIRDEKIEGHAKVNFRSLLAVNHPE